MSDGHGHGDQQQQQRHWGKRMREEDGQVRFSDLTPDQKMQRRRQERQEKKDRDRTLSYFRSAQRTMDEHARSGDPTVLANIVDGFFGELIKLLKGDPSFHLLRNGLVCRAIEAALGSALLLQSKTLLYVFLGHVGDLVTSPVASYTFETLLVSLSLGLSALSEANPEGFEAEMVEGGPGVHTGSGIASTATLLRAMVEELLERAEGLLIHEVGARALRSIVLVLGGFSIRNAPPPARPVRHEALLGTVAETVVAALEIGYGREYQTVTVAEAWLAAAQAPTTSFVVQSLLRVSVEGTPAHAAVVARVEALSHKNKPLLWHLMTDSHLGSHLFQAYTRAPVPAAVVEAGDREALRLEKRLRAEAAAAVEVETPGGKAGKKRASAADKLRAMAANDDGKAEGAAAGEAAQLLECCWGRGLRMVQTAFSVLVSGQQFPFILQDLALGAPTAAHLYLLWDEVFARHLRALLGNSTAGVAALAVLTRKCAFAGSSRTDAGEMTMMGGSGDGTDAGTTTTSGGDGATPADINAVLRADEGQGVRYFSVPMSLQRIFSDRICAALVECDAANSNDADSGSAARYLFVDGGALGDRGLDLARYLLHLHPTASLALQRGIAALPAAALLAAAEHHKGSVVLQQYARAASYWTATGRDKEAGVGGEAVLALLRAVEDRIHELVNSKYGAYVVETIYEAGSVAAKEALVETLTPIYSGLRDQPDAVVGNEEAMRRHVARKVMAKCCVEQYLHRREDWQRLAQRQVQVQRLMWRMLLEG